MISLKPAAECFFNTYFELEGRRGHDGMVVGFSTACAINAKHH